ncbi:methyl transferase-like protein [Moelleriella libera RCEF 2490]|uniref:phosphoethanolamine N-methyltransferase n=1 Tax=Moelleriella libera RCEF 2490 TaxID=1081109 RepID=A0A166RNG7_9HYPO|nr:methyl transferase-like protein [Moelleriella libera RCEF 2490]
MASSKPALSSSSPADDASFDVQRMALYNLERAQRTIDALADKELWVPEDTASVDCMHYLGDEAIAHCAETLRIRPGDSVLDIGSGFNATGRYLNRHYGAEVTGVELQTSIHAMGETITRRNGQSAQVRGVNANFIMAPQTVIAAGSVEHIVSFLCILHIPQRHDLFLRAAQTLKPNGRLYIEDFYARRDPLPEQDAAALRDVVSCPYLPSQETYQQDLEKAGFVDIQFEDVSDAWASFVSSRAGAYRASADPEPSLDTFYTTINDLFSRGNLGGVRISARRPA